MANPVLCSPPYHCRNRKLVFTFLVIQYKRSNSIIVFYLNTVNRSSNVTNYPVSTPLWWRLPWSRWMVHPPQSLGKPQDLLRVETSHQQWHQFGDIYMSLAISFSVAQGGGDATANWRKFSLARICNIYSRWRLNHCCCCREIGVVVSHSVKNS